MAEEPRVKQTALSQMLELMKEKLDEGGSVTFSPKGTSMLPMLRACGDSVTLKKPPARIKKGEVALFISKDCEGEERFVLHRLVKIKGESLYFLGDNRRTPDPPVTRDDIIAVVTAFNSRGKDYSCSSAFYRLYKNLKVMTRGVRPQEAKARGCIYRIWKRLKGKPESGK